MRKRKAVIGHSAALLLLGAWGILEVGLAAGTLSAAFWFAWLLYAAFLILMNSGSTVGTWIVLAPPALWTTFSGSDIVPQILTGVAGRSVSAQALAGALLVTLPCAAAVVIHLWYAAGVYMRWRVTS